MAVTQADRRCPCRSCRPRCPLRWETRFVEPEAPAVVEVTGELDRVSAPLLDDHLLWLEGVGCDPVVLDLAGVEFMDVGGYDLLVEAGRRGVQSGRDVIVQNPSRVVRRLLEIAGWPDGLY